MTLTEVGTQLMECMIFLHILSGQRKGVDWQ